VRSTGVATDPVLGYSGSYDPGDAGGGGRPRYNTIGALTPVYPRELWNERTLAIICTGQSVIANWGIGTLYTATSPRSHQANIMDGRVYAMKDPVLGADGTGGGPSSAIGDKLIAAGKYDRVTVCNVAFGSTSSAQWADPRGYLATGLKSAWALLMAHGYRTIVILHQQGEADASVGVSQSTMAANLNSFNQWRISAGIDCPMRIAQATFNYGGWVVTNPDPALWTPGPAAVAIRNAQAATWGSLNKVLRGPDCDLIRGPAYRGGAHWDTQAGAVACAQAWADLL
jgi:hypothetical protein